VRRVRLCLLFLTTIFLAGCASLFDKPAQELTFVSISAGRDHTVAVDSDGNVWAWGRNYYGQLGDGTNISKSVPVRVKIDTEEEEYLSEITEVAARNNHTIALDIYGNVWAWGRNNSGQLGDGAHGLEPDKSRAVRVRGPGGLDLLSGIVAIDAGYEYSVALDVNGNVWTWGNNAWGQLGDNTTDNRNTPVQVVSSDGKGSLSGIIAVAAGAVHVIAAGINGNVWAWGSNDHGQLGIGPFALGDKETKPVKVKGLSGEGYLSDITTLSAGEWHSIALDGSGNVYAWGNNSYGQLGIGSDFHYGVPNPVKGLDGDGLLAEINAVNAGGFHSLAFDQIGSVWAWGRGGSGQLGYGGNSSKLTPVQTKGPEGEGYLSGIEAIDGGSYHTVAIDEQGKVWAWGSNTYGQLGDGTSGSENRKNTPILVKFPD